MSTTAEVEMLPKSVPSGIRTMADKIPCNEAWTTLKNHPNIAFAGEWSKEHEQEPDVAS